MARLFAAGTAGGRRPEPVRRLRAARSVIASVAERIASYAGRDPELRELVKSLQAEQVTFAAPMAEANRKSLHFASANVARSRDVAGRSMKRS